MSSSRLAAAERFGTILLSSYIRFKKVTVCDNAEDCAQKLNFDKATLLQTISLYNNAVGTKVKKRTFDRLLLNSAIEPQAILCFGFRMSLMLYYVVMPLYEKHIRVHFINKVLYAVTIIRTE